MPKHWWVPYMVELFNDEVDNHSSFTTNKKLMTLLTTLPKNVRHTLCLKSLAMHVHVCILQSACIEV